MVVRKLRKIRKNYVNLQVPEVQREELGWNAGDKVNCKLEGKRLIVEKLDDGVRA